MRNIVLPLTIFLLMCVNLFPQHERLPTQLDEEKVMMNFSKPAIMDSTLLDTLIINTMNANHIPGMAALITTKEDGIIWKRNYGYANVKLNKLVEDSTLFMVGSISKTIVATAIMQFWEADSFNLDDNINDYLDDFQVINPYHPNDTITFRMLMIHSSGIKDNYSVFDPLKICWDSPITLDSLLVNYFTPGGIYYSTANFNTWKPGSWWDYSNFGVCILAYIIEKFAGTSFEQYCRDNIFDPLGMDSTTTSYLLAGLDTTTIATPYLWAGNQYIPYCHYGHPIYPVGSLRTNKIALEHFVTAYMNWGQYGGETILDSSTIDLILSDHLGYLVPGYGDIQGLVWYQTNEVSNNVLPWGHGGAWDGARAKMFFQQDENWGVMYFINSRPIYAVSSYILELLCNYAQEITTDIEEISYILKDFYLEQNYPNPFNPKTSIKYQVPKQSFVTLKVFNLLGEEIRTLVIKEKPAGSYEAEFDGSQLPSGIYFYGLQAGSFIETKKMVLIK